MPHILAHIYHASKISKEPAFLYGAIFPDNFEFLKKRHSTALKFARKLSQRNKKYELFYKGVKNHIELDNKFHEAILPPRIKKIQKKLNISPRFAHVMLEIALDSNLNKEEGEELKQLIKQFHRFNDKEVLYYLAGFIKLSEKFLIKISSILKNLVDLSTKFSIRALLKRAKLVEEIFRKEFKKNTSFIGDIFKTIRVFKYAKALTKDYKAWL